jgi:hypothetical protein
MQVTLNNQENNNVGNIAESGAADLTSEGFGKRNVPASNKESPESAPTKKN